jgi:hypothetical protein
MLSPASLKNDWSLLPDVKPASTLRRLGGGAGDSDALSRGFDSPATAAALLARSSGLAAQENRAAGQGATIGACLRQTTIGAKAAAVCKPGGGVGTKVCVGPWIGVGPFAGAVVDDRIAAVTAIVVSSSAGQSRRREGIQT